MVPPTGSLASTPRWPEAVTSMGCACCGGRTAWHQDQHYWPLDTDRTIIYFADGTRVSQPTGAAQAFDLKVWLRGLQPGDLAAGELNPLLWSRS
jgi:hypothetical protein